MAVPGTGEMRFQIIWEQSSEQYLKFTRLGPATTGNAEVNTRNLSRTNQDVFEREQPKRKRTRERTFPNRAMLRWAPITSPLHIFRVSLNSFCRTKLATTMQGLFKRTAGILVLASTHGRAGQWRYLRARAWCHQPRPMTYNISDVVVMVQSIKDQLTAHFCNVYMGRICLISRKTKIPEPPDDSCDSADPASWWGADWIKVLAGCWAVRISKMG